MNAIFASIQKTTAIVVLAASALGATACSGESPTGPSTGAGAGTATTTSGGSSGGTPSDSPAGQYRLVTVNGKSVPCVFDSFSPRPGDLLEMHAIRGDITMNADGTYLEEYEAQLKGNNLPHDVVTIVNVAGIYTVAGGVLTMKPLNGATFMPDYAGGRITFTTEAPALNGGTDKVTWTFQR